MEQVIHIKTPISRDDLDAVITGLEVACGGNRIEVTEAFDLVVKDDRQAKALKILFDPNGKSPEPALKKRKYSRGETKTGEKGGAHSYGIEGTNMFISAQALHRRLAARDTTLLGAVLVNSKGEKFHPTEDENGRGFRLVAAGKWEEAQP